MNDYLPRLTDAVNREILKGIEPRNGTLEAAMHYALTVNGKRLRPLLFLALLDAYQKDSEKFIGLASALEIIHTYSLIHDDLPVMDNDDLRRGLPTVHKKFNEAVALLAGDTLLTFAFEKIAAAPLPAEKTVAIIGIITRCIGKDGMAKGQALDLEFRGDALAIEAMERAGRYMGIAIANYLHIFNPSIVVLGGGVSRSGGLFFNPLYQSLRENVFAPGYLNDQTVTTAALGDDVGLLGALALAETNLMLS